MVGSFWINDPSRVFIARSGRHELTSTILDAAQVQELVERMLKSSGRRVDLSTPFVDAMLPKGHRLHVVLDGISRGFSAVKIRNQSHEGSYLPKEPQWFGAINPWEIFCAPPWSRFGS